MSTRASPAKKRRDTPDFFKHLEPQAPVPDPPTLVRCDTCGRQANPSYGYKGEVFCREHAPAHLRQPSRHAKEFQHDAPF